MYLHRHPHRILQHRSPPQNAAPIYADVQRACAMATQIARQMEERLRWTSLDVPEMQAEALAAWVESCQQWLPDRGAQPTTYAWPRMFGRPRDRLRHEERLVRRGPPTTTPEVELFPAVTPSLRLALHRAIEETRPQMTAAEVAVLQGTYIEGESLRQVAAQLGATDDAVQRAHKRLLRRLRASLEVTPTEKHHNPRSDMTDRGLDADLDHGLQRSVPVD